MCSVLDNDMIEMEIVPFIPKTKRGFVPTVPLCEMVNAIPCKRNGNTDRDEYFDKEL